MLADARNADLYPQYSAYIENKKARDAFRYIVGCASELTSFNCHPQRKGEVYDFRFIDTKGDQQPFAFIRAKEWLFYFRAPAVRSGKYSLKALRGAFGDASENSSGEWTVKLRSIEDVRRLWQLLEIE